VQQHKEACKDMEQNHSE